MRWPDSYEKFMNWLFIWALVGIAAAGTVLFLGLAGLVIWAVTHITFI